MSTVEQVAIAAAPKKAITNRKQVLAERLQMEVSQLSDNDVANLYKGNIGVLSPLVQAAYMDMMARHMGIDPLAHPFDLIPGDKGVVKLYANKSCSEQLKAMRNVHVEFVSDDLKPDYYRVILKGRIRGSDGVERWDTNIGACPIMSQSPDEITKAMKKAWTQAERRLVLAITGVGLSDAEDSSGGSRFAPPQYIPPPQATIPPPPASHDADPHQP